MDAASLIRCPGCRRRAPERRGRAMVCPGCGHELRAHGGYFDLLDGGVEPTASSPEQRLMESELIARIYERFWRPAFVRVFAGSGAGASTGGFPGELFIHKNAMNLDERKGPFLDLSCGPGVFTRAMAAAAPGEWVIGLDISRAMLDVAVRRVHGYANVVLVRGDAHDLPFGDGVFAAVNNAGALHVYDDPETVFREVLRVLAKGGVYVGSTFAPSGSLTGRVAARLAGIRRFEPSELRAWLSRIGFVEYEEILLGGALVFKVKKP
jgi:SAM-dependent methyltransferase